MKEIGVAVHNAMKNYGVVSAARDVSFELPKGQLMALLGPSGCGKTTTLNLIAGLIEITSGEILLGDRQINARADTILQKPAYRKAFERRRCIVPADGFYEWQAIEGTKQKQPWFIHRRDGEPLAFAGLWERWNDMRSFAIVTTDANDLLAPIHHRMPVVLPESEWERWLDPGYRDTGALQRLLVPLPDDEVEAWPVSLLVNKPDNNSSQNTEPVEVASA